MSFEKDVADFFHKLIEHLPVNSGAKKDLHREVNENTVPEGGEKTDANS